MDKNNIESFKKITNESLGAVHTHTHTHGVFTK